MSFILFQVKKNKFQFVVICRNAFRKKKNGFVWKLWRRFWRRFENFLLTWRARQVTNTNPKMYNSSTTSCFGVSYELWLPLYYLFLNLKPKFNASKRILVDRKVQALFGFKLAMVSRCIISIYFRPGESN